MPVDVTEIVFCFLLKFSKMAVVDIAGPVLGSRRHNLVMHDQYMKKYEEMQKTFSHRSLQLKREERELHKKLEAIVGKSSDSFALTKAIGLEPLPPRENSARQLARARTPFPRDPVSNSIIPTPPKGRPKSTVRGRRLSRSNDIYETKSEGTASPMRQPSPERGQSSVNGEDSEKRKRMAALSRRRNTVCSGVLTIQLEKLNKQRTVSLTDTDFEQPEEKQPLNNQEDEENAITDPSGSEKEIQVNETDNFNKESVSNNASSKSKQVSAIFCYKYEEGKEETEGKSVLVNSKFTSAQQVNSIASNDSSSSKRESDHENTSVLQENGNSKICRKMSIMSPVQECDGFEEESSENDKTTKNALAEQTSKTSFVESTSSNSLTYHQNNVKSQKNGISKFGRKLSLMSPVQESDWTEENSSDASDVNETYIRKVQSVNEILPANVADSRPEPSQTISLDFPLANTPSSDNSENALKTRIDTKNMEGLKARPTSSSVQRGRSPARRLSRSLDSSASPPAGSARLMHRRRSLDPNMLASMKQFQNVQVQRAPERQQPLNSLRRRNSVSDPSFQPIDMVGVDVGREKFKSIARRMLALSRGHQKDDTEDKSKTDDVPAEWKDIDKCRYLRSYVPKWDRE